MKDKEKAEIMQNFKAKKFDCLVSTTVIEVGVDVPDATIMIVYNAERFGLSQLHQLRGRVGRGSKQSYCFLLLGADGEEARARLAVLKNNTDGFKIAEYDLEMRGQRRFSRHAPERQVHQRDTQPALSALGHLYGEKTFRRGVRGGRRRGARGARAQKIQRIERRCAQLALTNCCKNDKMYSRFFV